MASSPPLIIVRIYNVQTRFEYLSRTKQLLKASNFLKFWWRLFNISATSEQLLGVLTSNFS